MTPHERNIMQGRLSFLESDLLPDNPCEGCNNAKGCIACVDGSERAVIAGPEARIEITDKDYFAGTLTIRGLDAAQYKLIHALVSTWNKGKEG